MFSANLPIEVLELYFRNLPTAIDLVCQATF